MFPHAVGSAHGHFVILYGDWKPLSVILFNFTKQQVMMAADGQSRVRHGFIECLFYLNICIEIWAEGQGRCRGGWSYVLHKVSKNIITVKSFSLFPHVCRIFYWTCYTQASDRKILLFRSYHSHSFFNQLFNNPCLPLREPTRKTQLMKSNA